MNPRNTFFVILFFFVGQTHLFAQENRAVIINGRSKGLPPTKDLANGDILKVRKVLLSAIEIKGGIAYVPIKQGKEIIGSEPFTGIALQLWSDNRIYTQQGYLNGQKNGFYKEDTEKGIFVAQENWVNGKKTGPFQYADEKTGIIVAEGEFLEDSLHNEVKGYYLNGNVQYIKHYNRGIRQGASILYFDNGAVEQQAMFVNDLPDGGVIAYYPDSTLRYFKEFAAGLPNGKFYMYHRNGCAANEEYYKLGFKDSISRAYDAVSCKLIGEGNWNHGNKNGVFIQYNPFEDTLNIETYRDGVLDGRYMEVKEVWDEANKRNKLVIEVQGNFVNGKREGMWVFGQASHYGQRSGLFADGEMIGKWTFMDSNGNLLIEQVYDKNGEVISEKKFKPKKKR